MAGTSAQRLRSALVVATAATLASGAASADLTWRYTPALSMGAAHDDNLRLATSGELEVVRTYLLAGADVAARNERLSLRFGPELRAHYFADDRERDRGDRFLDFEVAVSGARQRWALGGAYDRESTFTSEFDGSGLLHTDIDRSQSSSSLSWVRTAGERGRYEVLLSEGDTRYEEALLAPLVDYRYRVLNAGYTRAVSERASWRFVASRTLLDTEGRQPRTTSNSVRAVWQRRYSAPLEVRLGFGAFAAEGEGRLATSTTGAALEFGIERSFARWELSVSGGRQLQPSGRGTLTRDDGLTLSGVRRITSRLSAGLRLAANRVATAGSTLTEDDRDRGTGSAYVHWRLGRSWDMRFSIEKRTQQFTGLPEASSVAALVHAGYRPR